MGDTIETLKPFAIKAISARVADEITEAARTSVPKATVGQLIERVWDHWKQDGHPTVVTPDASRASSNDLATIERAVVSAVALASAPDVPRAFRRRANRLLRESLPAPAKATAPAPARLTGPPQET